MLNVKLSLLSKTAVEYLPLYTCVCMYIVCTIIIIISSIMKGTKVLTLGAGRYLYACDMRGTIIRIMRMRIAN